MFDENYYLDITFFPIFKLVFLKYLHVNFTVLQKYIKKKKKKKKKKGIDFLKTLKDYIQTILCFSSAAR